MYNNCRQRNGKGEFVTLSVGKGEFARTRSVMLEQLRAEAVNKMQEARDNLVDAGDSNKGSATIARPTQTLWS